MSTSRDQLIIISDVTPPIFIIVEAANEPMDWVNGSVLPHEWAKHPKGLNTSMSVRVPFFRNFRKWSSIPSVEDRATSNMFQAMGLVSSVRSLTSFDGELTVAAFDDGNNLTCRADGLARFERTWNAIDTCGNERVLTQQITVEHPPSTPQTTGIAIQNDYDSALDVRQHRATTWTKLGNGYCFSSVSPPEDSAIFGRSKTTLWGSEQTAAEGLAGQTEERLHQIGTRTRDDWVFARLVDAKTACKAEPRCVGIHYDTANQRFLKLSKLGTPNQDDDATAACKAEPTCVAIHYDRQDLPPDQTTVSKRFSKFSKSVTPTQKRLGKHACWKLTRERQLFARQGGCICTGSAIQGPCPT